MHTTFTLTLFWSLAADVHDNGLIIKAAPCCHSQSLSRFTLSCEAIVHSEHNRVLLWGFLLYLIGACWHNTDIDIEYTLKLRIWVKHKWCDTHTFQQLNSLSVGGCNMFKLEAMWRKGKEEDCGHLAGQSSFKMCGLDEICQESADMGQL